jgi:ribosomal protein S18 acetylase RimI-like enzyme
MKIINYSSFDSELFGKKTGRLKIESNCKTSEFIKDVLKEAEEENFKIIFLQELCQGIKSINAMKDSTFVLSDIKVGLLKDRIESVVATKNEFYITNRCEKHEISNIKKFVEQIAIKSQYYQLFGEETAICLYRKWVENSINGEAADKCYFLRSTKSKEVFGFISIEFFSKKAELILVALDSSLQGKGIGACFMKMVNNSLLKQDIESCNVGTQLTNVQALKFYNKLGFYFDTYRFDYITFL